MLLRAIVLVAFIAAIGEAMISGAAALGRAAFHASESRIVRRGFASAIASAQNAIATGASPQPIAMCAAANSQGCALTMRAAITQSTAAPQATGNCPGGQCTVVLQESTNVSESRQIYNIAVTLAARNGDLLVSRNGVVAFRTFNVPPYATLVGSLDATLDALVNGGAGDDGGSTSQAHGTLIHVEYRPASGGAGLSADAWRTQTEQPATVSPDWQR